MNDNSDSKVEYILRPDGIHEFTVKESSVSAVDAYYVELDRIYKARHDTHDNSQPVRLLTLPPKRGMPLDYMMQQAKRLLAKYPNVGTICSATLSDSLMETRIVDSFMRVVRLPGVRVRFFPINRRDDAIRWLLDQKN
jgi:hypothetical protein